LFGSSAGGKLLLEKRCGGENGISGISLGVYNSGAEGRRDMLWGVPQDRVLELSYARVFRNL